MYEQLPIATILLIAATCVVSIRAFGDRSLQDKLIFCPELILACKEYHRVVTFAFLHADARHLIFNMLTLYLFGRNLETVMGIERFLVEIVRAKDDRFLGPFTIAQLISVLIAIAGTFLFMRRDRVVAPQET